MNQLRESIFAIASHGRTAIYLHKGTHLRGALTPLFRGHFDCRLYLSFDESDAEEQTSNL